MDCDICNECKDHAGFEEDEETGECYSECCDAPPYDTDPDWDMER